MLNLSFGDPAGSHVLVGWFVVLGQLSSAPLGLISAAVDSAAGPYSTWKHVFSAAIQIGNR